MADVKSSDYHCIDTRVMDRCIAKKDNFIRRYDQINSKYAEILKKMEWQGEGADAFFDDANKVRTNLKGIGDILANMCNVLVEIRAVIEETDKGLGECNRNPEQR